MKVEYWECVHCNKNMNDVQGTTCKSSKNPDGKHYYTLKAKDGSSESYDILVFG